MTKTDIRKKGRYAAKISRTLSRFRKEQDGVTAVEFAILGPLFFFMLASLLEVTIFFFSSQYLDSSVNTVAREIRVGIIDSTTSKEDFKQRVCDEIVVLLSCDKIQVDLQVVADFEDLGEDRPTPVDGQLDDSEYGFTPPEAEQIVQLTVQYPWPVYTNFVAESFGNLDNAALMNSVVVFRTEPFS